MLIGIAYVLDVLFGDPEWLPHPVRGIGCLISALDKIMRGNRSPITEKIKGIFFALIIIGLPATLVYFFVKFALLTNTYLGLIVIIYFYYSFIAIKDMKVKALEIVKALDEDDTILARKKLSMIVGRDTENLDKKKIVTATIESVSESICDGIVAPIFYLAIGGPVLGIVYKSISTLDSMVGYKNEKYKNFGWFSARLDDAANYIPARITAVFIVLSAWFLKMDNVQALRILIRDGQKHPSPNSGLAEAAVAGALKIRLGGPSTYGGKLSNKDFLGDDVCEPLIEDINKVINVSYVVSFLFIGLVMVIEWLV